MVTVESRRPEPSSPSHSRALIVNREHVELAPPGVRWTTRLPALLRPALICALLWIAPAVRAQPATSCLSSLHGSWRGPGTVLGRAITMEQDWASAVGGAFTSLSMRHLPADGGTTASFQGLGIYRARGDSVMGTWHDSRGISFTVSGRCADGVFSSRWSGVERGLTVYTRRGDSLMVIDSVFPPTGAAREFGRSVLGRHAPGRAGEGPRVGAVPRR